jgi:malyl-CoA/(S)-citramalyl-CoA lyase
MAVSFSNALAKCGAALTGKFGFLACITDVSAIISDDTPGWPQENPHPLSTFLQCRKDCCAATKRLQLVAQHSTAFANEIDTSLRRGPQMSFRLQPIPPARPNRCQLFGPGSRPALFAKMAASAADVINLDLEDSVAPTDKDKARANVIDAIGSVDWGNKRLSVRINGLDTPWWYRDVVDLLEQASDRLDQIMIPKVGCAADIYAVDALVTAVERAKGRSKPISFEVIIESAAGIAHVEEIAAASPRLQAMSLGAADFAASMGMQTTGIGGTQEDYYMIRDGVKHWADPWHWAQAAIVAACRTHGVLPVDGPFGDFSDDAGFQAQARRSAVLGMVGKWAIHPKQIALANEVFTPSEAAVTEAREILSAMADAKARGEGATVYKGRLVDIASIKQAEVIVRQSEMIAG